MKHAGTAFLVVMLFSTLGLWGIAQQKNGAYASRLRDLEARQAKFEEEQRVHSQQAEKNQRRIAALETEKAELTVSVEELKTAVAERDDLRKLTALQTRELATSNKERNDLRIQLGARTQERDQMSQELKQFSQDLQGLLGRVEASIAGGARNGVNVGGVEATPASRRSE